MMTQLRFTLRLPGELHDEIRDEAVKNRRSIHAQILWLIERGLEVARLRGLLARLEWSGTGGLFDDRVSCCPACGGYEAPYATGADQVIPAGHAGGCWLAEALKP